MCTCVCVCVCVCVRARACMRLCMCLWIVHQFPVSCRSHAVPCSDHSTVMYCAVFIVYILLPMVLDHIL